MLVSQGQDANTYDPAGLLDFGQTYYWRVDEVNAAPDSTIYKGATWSFTAETYGYAVKPIKATASSSSTTTTGARQDDRRLRARRPGPALDLAVDRCGSARRGCRRSGSNMSSTQVYKLYQMWVWNSNQAIEPDVGFGAKDVTVETSLDGTTWTALAGVPEFAQATGEPNYVHNTTVDFGGVQAKYRQADHQQQLGGATKQAGLSEVRFFYVPVQGLPAYAGFGSHGSGHRRDPELATRPGGGQARGLPRHRSECPGPGQDRD